MVFFGSYEFFVDVGIVVSVRFGMDEDGWFCGFGYVEFEIVEDV